MQSVPPTDSAEVGQRRVFYIPGYDPIHPRRYRELYRTEAAEQGRLSGFSLQLKPIKGGARYGWQSSAQFDGKNTETRFDVLVWSDLVRQSMSASIAGTYLMLIRTAWTYISSGALLRLTRLRKGPVIAALYPVLMLLVQALLAIAGGLLLARALLWLAARAGAPLTGLPASLVFCAALLGGFILLLRWFRAQDRRFFAYYLMHDYSYSARWNGANPPELEARLAEFRAQIAAALTEPVDEVLVVGHSSGAHLAVSVLADLLRAGELPKDGPVLSFLSLGQVIPMVSILPRAGRLRRDLQLLSGQDRIFWLDVTAPGDGCCFALCDPAAVSGVAPHRQSGPLILSAAFSQTLSPARWKALRWRFFRLHFQYLCAFDNLPGQPSDYDYFRTTAGPLTLKARYAGRKPSAQILRRAVSPFTSMDAR